MRIMKFFVLVICFLLIISGQESFAFDVEAGPIQSQTHADRKCPTICQRAGGRWNGDWTPKVAGQNSECGCKTPVVIRQAPACFTAPVPRPDPNQSPNVLAKSFCAAAHANNWSSFQLTADGTLHVTCCKDSLPLSSVSPEFARLIDAANKNPSLKSELRSSSGVDQYVSRANALGYRITKPEVVTALARDGYSGKRTVDTRSSAGHGCGGLWQWPCAQPERCVSWSSSCWLFGTICSSTCTGYSASPAKCNGGYRLIRAGHCWPEKWMWKRVVADARNFDIRWGLPMDWKRLTYVTELKRGAKLPADGLYIFVYRTTDYKLLIRRSDRPDDTGCYAQGEKRYDFFLNPAGNGEEPHMFVRHTQLNGGWSTVWSAGQLEIHGRKIIWVSNQSGHYGPKLKSLDYVVDTLEAWGLAAKDSVHRFNYGTVHDKPADCTRVHAGVPGRNKDEL